MDWATFWSVANSAGVAISACSFLYFRYQTQRKLKQLSHNDRLDAEMSYSVTTPDNTKHEQTGKLGLNMTTLMTSDDASTQASIKLKKDKTANSKTTLSSLAGNVLSPASNNSRSKSEPQPGEEDQRASLSQTAVMNLASDKTLGAAGQAFAIFLDKFPTIPANGNVELATAEEFRAYYSRIQDIEDSLNVLRDFIAPLQQTYHLSSETTYGPDREFPARADDEEQLPDSNGRAKENATRQGSTKDGAEETKDHPTGHIIIDIEKEVATLRQRVSQLESDAQATRDVERKKEATISKLWGWIKRIAPAELQAELTAEEREGDSPETIADSKPDAIAHTQADSGPTPPASAPMSPAGAAEGSAQPNTNLLPKPPLTGSLSDVSAFAYGMDVGHMSALPHTDSAGNLITAEQISVDIVGGNASHMQ